MGAERSAAVVGMSEGETSGMRDHAVLLAQALAAEGVSCSVHWLAREHRSLAAGHAETRAWASSLRAQLAREQPDAILFHYSPFAYSYRGVPLLLRSTLAALRGSRLPVVTFMHECAYPWHMGGLRGKLWAVTQRAALIDVMRASRAVVLTTDFRVDWLASRRWLPRMALPLAPVFSNLPAPSPLQGPERGNLIGLFGFAFQDASVALVLDALGRLRQRGVEARLWLLGAPGPTSAAGEAWLAGARERGLSSLLSFSGRLPAQELSDALARCDVLLSASLAGPSSRKGTLAASLASGRPLLAIDGPRRWSELLERDAAAIVQPTADALADALAATLADDARADALGARGRAFAEERMSIGHSAAVVAALFEDALRERAWPP
jgi:glycosyltransferase involved in cell wall biosynthesis